MADLAPLSHKTWQALQVDNSHNCRTVLGSPERAILLAVIAQAILDATPGRLDTLIKHLGITSRSRRSQVCRLRHEIDASQSAARWLRSKSTAAHSLNWYCNALGLDRSAILRQARCAHTAPSGPFPLLSAEQSRR